MWAEAMGLRWLLRGYCQAYPFPQSGSRTLGRSDPRVQGKFALVEKEHLHGRELVSQSERATSRAYRAWRDSSADRPISRESPRAGRSSMARGHKRAWSPCL
ncbi:hypothetical protein BDW71DRAFT_188207 [Aspergillus fruticulosus]